MNLRQAEEYLLDLELFGMRFGLDRMHRLMTVLGLPQRRFASIHVVGHERQVLDRAHDRRDPGAPRPAHGQLHLAAPALVPERIEVGEQPVSEADFAAAVTRAAHAAELVNRTAGRRTTT